MVMGPTPPGTGVMNEAFRITLFASTSPTVSPEISFIPISITIALSFINLLLTNFGLPMATIRISAS